MALSDIQLNPVFARLGRVIAALSFVAFLSVNFHLDNHPPESSGEGCILCEQSKDNAEAQWARSAVLPTNWDTITLHTSTRSQPTVPALRTVQPRAPPLA